ncbi:hypothetical protein NDU88_005643 [Pleurodeles waltl]|uniref:Uncharacterized protein n=1 Tax=Pleurodeles waltl TaxID=8319 RepID=A0AAV7M9Y6_PLEWA|nr:hypothetical protein NDU88_005643 [Pleurodeles waltl]
MTLLLEDEEANAKSKNASRKPASRGGTRGGRNARNNDSDDESEDETPRQKRNANRRHKVKDCDEDESQPDEEIGNKRGRRNRGKNAAIKKQNHEESNEKLSDNDDQKTKKKTISPTESDAGSEEDEISMTEEEMEKLKEHVEEKKKLIATIRNKPWRMKKKLSLLRDSQAFVEKFEGALGKGKGKKFYAYKVMMMKKWIKFKRDFDNFRTACIPWEMKIKEVESKSYLTYCTLYLRIFRA